MSITLPPSWYADITERAETSQAFARRPLAALSLRQREVALLVAEGLTNAVISDRLSLTEHTIKNHLTEIFKQLGIRSDGYSSPRVRLARMIWVAEQEAA